MNAPEIAGLSELRGETPGDPRVTVAILDGAVDLSHPCFAGADLSQLGGLTSGRPTVHGTHVASVVFGREAGGVAGIAPACRGLVVPIFEERDGQIQAASQLDLARALREAVAAGATVVNVSGGQLTPSGKAESFLADAVAYCAAKGVLIVAAAGNEGCECLHVPAALPSVLAVGAMGDDGAPLDFSNWGYQDDGLLAPGEGVVGAAVGGGTAVKSGTSFATPVVTGVVALLLSEQRLRGEPADTGAVRTALLGGVRACDPRARSDCRRFLAGQLDLAGARRLLGPGASAPGESVSEDAASIRVASETDLCDNQSKDQGGSNTVSDEIHEESAACGAEAPEASPPREPARPEGETPAVLAAADAASDRVVAADCGCGGAAGNGSLVYAIGELGYDFGTEARLDSFHQSFEEGNPHIAADLLTHLGNNPWEADAVIWTLNLDATAIYAVAPGGPFASVAYERLREFLNGQLEEGVERVSAPGTLAGTARLFNGQTVPVIWPELRGMYSWSTGALVEVVAGPAPAEGTEEYEQHQKKNAGVRNFLARVYHELRNLGRSAEERAINFAATNAFQATQIFHDASGEDLELDSIEVERSPICRPDSDCWDVKLTFFDPKERLTTARRVHRYTVDVSDVIPVTVGAVRSWAVY